MNRQDRPLHRLEKFFRFAEILKSGVFLRFFYKHKAVFKFVERL